MPNEVSELMGKAAPIVSMMGPMGAILGAGMAWNSEFDRTGRMGSSLKKAGKTFVTGKVGQAVGGQFGGAENVGIKSLGDPGYWDFTGPGNAVFNNSNSLFTTVNVEAYGEYEFIYYLKKKLNNFETPFPSSAQIIDDKNNKTLVSASSYEKEQNNKIKKIDLSAQIADLLAKRALEKKITKVFFDRGRHKYHGIIKVFAETLRKKGLNF